MRNYELIKKINKIAHGSFETPNTKVEEIIKLIKKQRPELEENND
tara:strand:- start:14514 stop:14648 length:135 start_codon:yes stop_codon:yes gene_type:complete